MHFTVLVTLLFGMLLGAQAAETVVTHTTPRSEGDQRYVYNVKLLEAALEATKKTHGDFVVQPTRHREVSRKRQLALVEQGKLDVTWAAASRELQEQLTAVKIPIFKGLLGYRLFLVNDDHKERFAKIKNLEELKNLKMCTGLGWGVTGLYEHYKFNLLISPAYEGLFEMIQENRADYFSRGVNEIFSEYESYKKTHPKLHIDTHLAFYHPLPFYVYTAPTKEGKALAARIEQGMKIMVQNGDFDRLFNEYHGDLLEKSAIGSRQVFEISNPFLPDDVPLDKKEYWIDVSALK